MTMVQSRTSNKRTRPGVYLLFGVGVVWALIVLVSLNLPQDYSYSSAAESFAKDFLADFKNGPYRPRAPHPKPDKELHMIFSTGCSVQQDWESYVLFYHAYKVNQPGNVTRLVSGCDSIQERVLRKFHNNKIATMSDRFHVFFTPDFGNGPAFRRGEYKYNNKPNSVYLWMKDILGMDQNNRSKEVEDGIVLLVDPDMILLRPLLHDFSHQEMLYVSESKDGSSRPFSGGTRAVEHGKPMAQQDGYLADEWMKFDVEQITDGGRFPKFGPSDGALYWNSGPPYLATVRDMWKMVGLWKDYVPRVYHEYPKLFAEMYGLIIAAVQLDLPHTLVKSIVVSMTESDEREGWSFVDDLPDEDVCDVNSWSRNPRMPIVLHYCGRYHLGKFFFSKYRLKKNYISCEAPLLTMPPKQVHTKYSYWVRPPPDRGFEHHMEVKNLTFVQAKREAFMLCGLISSVNEAARYFKSQHCNGTGNVSEIYNFHDDPYS